MTGPTPENPEVTPEATEITLTFFLDNLAQGRDLNRRDAAKLLLNGVLFRKAHNKAAKVFSKDN